MKAARFTKYGAPEVVGIEDVPAPVPGDDDVLVRVRATTVTAVDAIFRRGNQFFARLYSGPLKPKLHVLGTEFAGDVQAVGENVTKFHPGERVFGSGSEGGTHAELIGVGSNSAMATMPANLSYEEAAAMPYGVLTALPFLRDNGGVAEGQRVLINGAAGTIGTYAVQLARHMGAIVTGVCGASNADLVTSLGASDVIDYAREDFTRQDRTYDVVFDTVGKSSFTRCKRILSANGRYLSPVIGWTILAQTLWTSKIGKKKAVFAATGLRPPREREKDLVYARGLIEAKALRPVIDRAYPLSQIVDAHRYEDAGHKSGSIVITMA